MAVFVMGLHTVPCEHLKSSVLFLIKEKSPEDNCACFRGKNRKYGTRTDYFCKLLVQDTFCFSAIFILKFFCPCCTMCFLNIICCWLLTLWLGAKLGMNNHPVFFCLPFSTDSHFEFWLCGGEYQPLLYPHMEKHSGTKSYSTVVKNTSVKLLFSTTCI